MKKNDMPKPSLLFSFLLLVTRLVSAQDTVRFSIANDFDLVDYGHSVIHRENSLDPFFEKLYQLKKEKKGTVNILHIGDSHIQADYQTHQLRQNFQREFGNAGRGFVAPFKVGQTNEPSNYTSFSESKWESKRMVFPEQPLPMGLGGVSIRSIDEHASLKISLKNYTGLNYQFSKVTAFFQSEKRSFHMAIQDSIGQDLAFMGNFSMTDIANTVSVALPYPANSVSLKIFKSLPQQDRITFFGFNFENGRPGVLYHAMGANGAKFKHYLSSEYFVDQSQALKPDLIVLALGTNEALDHPYSDPTFTEHVQTFVQRLKSKNPEAVFLIFIPGESFKRKNKKNPAVLTVREKLMDYATANKLAVYDLYAAGGGSHSATEWRKVELLRDDGVHFTRAGYELQGDMFYLAIMKAYNQYVSDRRK
jgi:lysophospholipase L1-like esterase